MDEPLKLTLALAYGYLLGSVNMAYLVARVVKGIDLRKHGSGSVGASNVWYLVGKGWIFPVGIFDLFVKGGTPVWLARYTLDLDLSAQVMVGLLAIVGHNWPVFLRFHGGRGVAPIVGVLIALARMELVLFIVVATVGWRLTNSAGFWTLLSLLLLPVWALLWERPLPIVLLMVGVIVITVIKRLTANALPTDQIPLGRLLLNRLLLDRDIADHDTWVQRQPPPATE